MFDSNTMDEAYKVVDMAIKTYHSYFLPALKNEEYGVAKIEMNNIYCGIQLNLMNLFGSPFGQRILGLNARFMTIHNLLKEGETKIPELLLDQINDYIGTMEGSLDTILKKD